jgi:phytoene synthase
MLADVDTDRYETYDDLAAYMDGSASAVGRMMTDVMLSDAPDRVYDHATALGQAFQLTNFVRDVREDVVERDRVYLPRSTLERYGADVADVEDLTVTPAVRDAVRHELERAEELYREGVAGIPHLPADCQFAVLLAAVLYAEHHRLVRRRDYDTVSATPSLSTPRTLALALRTRWHWHRNPDPEAVFEAVSAVDPVGAGQRRTRPRCRFAVGLSTRLRDLFLR